MLPYANLTPAVILNAIEQAGFPVTGSLLALNSFENRVYQIGIEDSTPVIAKFYRPNRWSDAAILEEHQFAEELMSHEIPVVAPLKSSSGETLHHYEEFRFAVFPRHGGRPLELDNIDQLQWMGRFIGRLHAVGATKNFQHRLTLDVQTYGYDSYRFLLENNFIPKHLQQRYCQVIESVLAKIENCYAAVGHIDLIRLHGDCHPGNVLWNDYGPRIVDLDDSCMGPAMQDIWMLLSGHFTESHVQLDYILQGYADFYDYNPREIYLIEPLRTLRLLQYAAWLAMRWEDPAFPLNFPWFNTESYWQEWLSDIVGQLEVLAECEILL